MSTKLALVVRLEIRCLYSKHTHAHTNAVGLSKVYVYFLGSNNKKSKILNCVPLYSWLYETSFQKAKSITSCDYFIFHFSFPALVFNFVTQQLATPSEDKDSKGDSLYYGTSCIFACPTDSNDETQNLINKERSITGYGIFSKYFYENEVL